MTYEAFEDRQSGVAVRGFLHRPERANGNGLVLTHGAGADCQSKLLVAVAEAVTTAGFVVLRCDLAFRQERPTGPPSQGGAARDREGLRRAAEVLRERVKGRVFLGGHSYGGRQISMLAAEDSSVADGLLLLSYPLHPPEKPQQLRTRHFPKLKTPAFFVQGTKDPFGTMAEMQTALREIPARHALLEIGNAGHDLAQKKSYEPVADRVVEGWKEFAGV